MVSQIIRYGRNDDQSWISQSSQKLIRFFCGKKRGGACQRLLPSTKTTHVRFSELELERELEVALRVRAAIGGRVDDAACATERADEAVRVVEIDVVEEVYRFDAELSFDTLGESELLEERSVGSPVTGAAQRVALLVAEGPRSSGLAEDAQVLDVPDLPISIPEGSGLDIAVDVRPASSVVRDAGCIEAIVERHAALERSVRVELPASDEQVGFP